MRYTIHFASGNTLSIDETRYEMLMQYNDNNLPGGLVLKDFINMRNIDYIVPEEETVSGVTTMPKPEDMRLQQKEENEKIIGDSQEILKRAVDKFDR